MVHIFAVTHSRFEVVCCTEWKGIVSLGVPVRVLERKPGMYSQLRVREEERECHLRPLPTHYPVNESVFGIKHRKPSQ